MTNDVCETCRKTHPWDDGHMPIHPFNPGGLRGSQALKQPVAKKSEPGAAVPTAWPFDPVLRQGLIDKGVLTPDDLRDAEAKIRAVTATFEQGVSDASHARTGGS